jgi:hypothetical protein
MNNDAFYNFSIPAWVRWIAQDSTGVWWGYSVEPLRHDSGWYENEVGDYVRLGVTAPEDWENSLVKR